MIDNPKRTRSAQSDPSQTQKVESSDKEGLVAFLVIIEGENFAKQFPIKKDTTIIGRDEECDLIVDDGKTSRQHFMIKRTERKLSHFLRDDGNTSHRHSMIKRIKHASELVFTIKDLKSTNGTFLNGFPVTEHELENGDKILAGKTLIGFLLKDPADIKCNSNIWQDMQDFSRSNQNKVMKSNSSHLSQSKRSHS